MYQFFILITAVVANSCSNLAGGITYGTNNSDGFYNTTQFNSTDELLPVMCQIYWANYPNVWLDVIFYRPDTPKFTSINDTNSCQGITGGMIAGIDQSGMLVNFFTANSFDQILELICESWVSDPTVAIVGVYLESN